MTYTRCEIRQAVAAAGLCAICLGGLAAPSAQHHHQAPAAAVTVDAAQPAGWPGHGDQPHTPELEPVRLPGPDTEINDRHVLVLDDPVHGQLDGKHYLAGCAACPIAGQGRTCWGPCPGEA